MDNKKEKHIPLRMCVGCREMKTKQELVRIVVCEDSLIIDETYKRNGRGIYLCKNSECVAAVQKKKALSKLLKKPVGDDFYKELAEYVSG